LQNQRKFSINGKRKQQRKTLLAKRRKNKVFYTYDCSISGESYKLTKESKTPEELICLQSYYELNPEMDDRPEAILNEINQLKKTTVPVSKTWEELVELSLKQKAVKAEREEATKARARN
jgi:hypothetical protein